MVYREKGRLMGGLQRKGEIDGWFTENVTYNNPKRCGEKIIRMKQMEGRLQL